MPTRTRPPDLLARPGQDSPLAVSGPGKPPGVVGSASADGSLGAAEEPPWAGPGKPPGVDGSASAAGPGKPPGVDGSASAAGPGKPPGPSDTASADGSLGAAEEPPWAGLRLVAVPNGWPPYDCETHGAGCPAATPVPVPRGEAAPREKTVPRGEAAPRRAAEPRGAAEPRLAAAWPGQFGQVLVEILAGFRPAKQLAPWTTEQVRAQIDLLSYAVAAEQRPRIRRVMTSRPTADVVEMTMVVGFGPRSRALAIRFERIPARPPAPGRPARPARWLCTEIETS
jgi:uncharacterized protein DUF6459